LLAVGGGGLLLCRLRPAFIRARASPYHPSRQYFAANIPAIFARIPSGIENEI